MFCLLMGSSDRVEVLAVLARVGRHFREGRGRGTKHLDLATAVATLRPLEGRAITTQVTLVDMARVLFVARDAMRNDFVVCREKVTETETGHDYLEIRPGGAADMGIDG